jgi:MFS family permease
MGWGISEWQGRRTSLIVANLFGIVGASMSVVLDLEGVFGTGRALCGIGAGMFFYTIPVMIKEIVPTDIASKYISMHQLFITLGASFVFYMAMADFKFGFNDPGVRL